MFVSILCTCCSHFFWYCFISFTMFCTPVFCLIHWLFSLSSFVIPSKCLKNFICAASKRCSSLFFSTQASLPNFNAALAVMLWILNFVSLFICFPKCLRIAPFILLYVCNLSCKSLLYSDMWYPKYLKSVTCSIILSDLYMDAKTIVLYLRIDNQVKNISHYHCNWSKKRNVGCSFVRNVYKCKRLHNLIIKKPQSEYLHLKCYTFGET